MDIANQSPTIYFDLQANGFAGVDFQQTGLEYAALKRAVKALLKHNTGHILLTLVTDRIDALCAKLANIEKLCGTDPELYRVIVGYHIEGPYISSDAGYHGAHDPARTKDPCLAEFDLLHEAAQGRIRLITLAPELPRSAEFIRHITSKGVVASIGHSNASDQDIDEAISAGLSMCTHLGNGLPIMVHRHDNIVQRLLARDELYAVFIPDGIHLPRSVLRNYVRAKPRHKVLFTTDCMAAAGAGAGRFNIGRIAVDVGVDGVVREPGKLNFAGSSLTMDRGVANIQKFLDWNESESIAACSTLVRASLRM